MNFQKTTVIYRISFHLAQYFKICRAQKIGFSHLNFPFCCPLHSPSCGAHCTRPPDHRSFVRKIAGAHFVTFPKLKRVSSSASSFLHISDIP